MIAHLLVGAGQQPLIDAARTLSDFDLVAGLLVPDLLTSRCFTVQMLWIKNLYFRTVMNPPQPPPDDPSGGGTAGSRTGGRSGGRKPKKRRKALTREDLTRAEIQARLRLTPTVARQYLTCAMALTTRLLATRDALWDGRLTPGMAQAAVQQITPMAEFERALRIAGGDSPVEAEQAARRKAREVEDRVLDESGGQTASTFSQRLRKAVAGVHPVFADFLARNARRARRISCQTGLPGDMASLIADLGAPEAIQIMGILDRHARRLYQQNKDDRTLDQLTADVFVDYFLHPERYVTHTTDDADGFVDAEFDDVETESSPHRDDDREPADQAESVDHTESADQAESADTADDTARVSPGSPASTKTPGKQRGRNRKRGHRLRHTCPRAHIFVTVSLDTLLGLSDEPGELRGYGPITAALARDIAMDPESTWRRLVTDPLSGTLLDYGRTKYKPPKPLDDHVRARDVSCWHCNARIERCDLDHAVRFPYGPTSDRNLCAKCRHAHRLKHEGGWNDEPSDNPNDPAGSFTTTSPTGQKYKRQPAGLGPIHQPQPAGAPTATGPDPERVNSNREP